MLPSAAAAWGARFRQGPGVVLRFRAVPLQWGLMVRVEHVLDSWRAIRDDGAQALLDLPDGDLAYRPCPGVMTFGEIARHILDTGHALVRLMLDGVRDLEAPDFRQMLSERRPQVPGDADAAALAGLMRESLEACSEELGRQPEEFYAGMMTRWDGQRLTRLEMLGWIKEHELTHRSQLFLYLRLKGVVPVTTRRRLARQRSPA